MSTVESVQTFGRKVRRVHDLVLWINLKEITNSHSIENFHCMCLRQEGLWINQDQWFPNLFVATWNLEIKDIRTNVIVGCRQVRQRKWPRRLILTPAIISPNFILYRSISESESRVVELLPKSMPSDKPSLRALSLTTKNVSKVDVMCELSYYR